MSKPPQLAKKSHFDKLNERKRLTSQTAIYFYSFPKDAELVL